MRAAVAAFFYRTIASIGAECRRGGQAGQAFEDRRRLAQLPHFARCQVERRTGRLRLEFAHTPAQVIHVEAVRTAFDDLPGGVVRAGRVNQPKLPRLAVGRKTPSRPRRPAAAEIKPATGKTVVFLHCASLTGRLAAENGAGSRFEKAKEGTKSGR